MEPSEFQDKLTYWMILCEGWPTGGVRNIEYATNNMNKGHIDLRAIITENCQLQAKDDQVPAARLGFITYPYPVVGKFTYGELFIKMCDRDGLRAIDEGTHFRVQPKQ